MVPHIGESGQVIEGDNHAKVLLGIRRWRPRRVDEDPEVKGVKTIGFLPCCDGGNFSLGADVSDSFRPRGSDLDKYVVLEDLQGFMVDLTIGAENGEMEVV